MLKYTQCTSSRALLIQRPRSWLLSIYNILRNVILLMIPGVLELTLILTVPKLTSTKSRSLNTYQNRIYTGSIQWNLMIHPMSSLDCQTYFTLRPTLNQLQSHSADTISKDSSWPQWWTTLPQKTNVWRMWGPIQACVSGSVRWGLVPQFSLWRENVHGKYYSYKQNSRYLLQVRQTRNLVLLQCQTGTI